MPQIEARTPHQWLRTGNEYFAALLAAIDSAQASVCLEMYTFTDSDIGLLVRAALVRARARGARVRVLLDAVGSIGLARQFWKLLEDAGGEVRVFNPLNLNRFGIRDHRKLLVCDERIAIVGGFNVAPEYEGDGVQRGWFDLGLKVEGSLAGQLAPVFETMFARADFRHKRFMRFRRLGERRSVSSPGEQILLGGPGRGGSPLKVALHHDLRRAREVKIIVAYFLPTRKLRRDLTRVAQRGGRVQLILAAKSDVALSQLAGRSLYRRLLKSGVEIYEYQPQILHAKIVIADDAVYIGSSNLDQRSLQINYELMLRFRGGSIVDEAREIFADALERSRAITRQNWRESQTFWSRLKQRWAHFLLVRVDPYLARRQWRALPD